MDGVSNVMANNQQQTKMDVGAKESQVVSEVKQAQEQKPVTSAAPKINSKEQVEELVSQLNHAMSPMNTNLKFGVDPDDIFYVSVVESETSKMIRRFPVEKAASFLPKMQEVSGMLFDSKG